MAAATGNRYCLGMNSRPLAGALLCMRMNPDAGGLAEAPQRIAFEKTAAGKISVAQPQPVFVLQR